MKKTASTHKKWLETHGKWVSFVHRSLMTRRPMNKASLPEHPAPTVLPVDCTGSATVVCPMDGNDTLGDCGPVMAAHVDSVWTFGQGKPGFTQIEAPVPALEAQYEQVSGGDNGTTEDMLVGPSGVWSTGVAGDTSCVVVDHLDVDFTNLPLLQFVVDQFYAVCMGWSVPDDFLSKFSTGSVWDAADTGDPNNGHWTPLADIDSGGRFRLWTWGTWCWVSPAFIASVDPSGFAVFSPLQFSKSTGLDSHGRHVSDQAAAWIKLGGNASIVNGIVSQFPAKAA